MGKFCWTLKNQNIIYFNLQPEIRQKLPLSNFSACRTIVQIAHCSSTNIFLLFSACDPTAHDLTRSCGIITRTDFRVAERYPITFAFAFG